jgi:hypothetical protein
MTWELANTSQTEGNGVSRRLPHVLPDRRRYRHRDPLYLDRLRDPGLPGRSVDQQRPVAPHPPGRRDLDGPDAAHALHLPPHVSRSLAQIGGAGAEVYSGKFIIETIERLIYVDNVTLEKITYATEAYLALIVLSFWFRPIARKTKAI